MSCSRPPTTSTDEIRLMLGLGEPRKYQFMEQNLQRRVVGLKDKLPDIRKTLDTVRFLKLRTVRQQIMPLGFVWC